MDIKSGKAFHSTRERVTKLYGSSTGRGGWGETSREKFKNHLHPLTWDHEEGVHGEVYGKLRTYDDQANISVGPLSNI